MQVTGRVIRTLVRGHTVYDETGDAVPFAPRGSGRFISPTPALLATD
jgi:hypothetical protein